MVISQKQLFILIVCLNSASEPIIRDLCHKFDFGNCPHAPIKRIKERIILRLREHLSEPAIDLPTDKPKRKTKHKPVFVIKNINLRRPAIVTKNMNLKKPF